MTSSPSIGRNVFRFFSSLGLATALILLLMLLTWLATLEQVSFGLFPTLRKYFDYRELVVFADAGIFKDEWIGKPFLILPGGYWVCALLLVNMTLGGLLRIRKGWKTAGVLMAHFGILFMIASGGVAQWKEERGVMVLREGETSNWARSLTDPAIEVLEVKDGKPVGEVRVIEGDCFEDLVGERRRTVRLPDLPFDLELQTFFKNAAPVSALSRAPEFGEPVVDDFFLMKLPAEKESERDLPGCYGRALLEDGTSTEPFILPVASFQPVTVTADERKFLVRMVKQTWHVPFDVRLKSTAAEYYPNTRRPKAFQSEIVRIEEGSEVDVKIVMNEPMRHGGLTFFQRDFNAGETPGAAKLSGFEVVRNPSDKWPEYSLYVVTAGLLLHFLMKLSGFLGGNRSKKEPKA